MTVRVHEHSPPLAAQLEAAQAALLASQQRLHGAELRLRQQDQLLDRARDAIVVLDLDHTIRYWNRGAQRLFGYSTEQALGRKFSVLMGAGSVPGADAHAQMLEKGEWTGMLDCVDAHGRELEVERYCTVMRDGSDRPVAVLCINSDMTEQRRAEKEIVLLNNLLEQRIRRRTAQLEESNEDLRDFAYSLAHDLRAPLASIDGFSSRLASRLACVLDDQSRHYISRVRAGVRRMSDLTDGLLALADLSNTELRHESVDLSSIANAVADRLREQDPARQATIVIEATPPAHGDARLLTEVLENLLGNAWKFTSRTGHARIVFGSQPRPDGSCLYHVKDNGAGFDPAYAHKLFGPFQRLHTAGEFEGTGIGLAIVRKIVWRHGGRVWGESSAGEGASFYFTLDEPASPGQPEATRSQG